MLQNGFSWILIMRALQGMSFAGNFTVIGAFCSRWTYFKQVEEKNPNAAELT